MIKLPKKIVIYPQKLDVPDYLLCWIPPESFQDVSGNSQVEEELTKYYPNGLEIELSDDEFDEFGIRFETTPEKLHQAYLELADKGMFPASGMVELEILTAYIEERGSGHSINEITDTTQPGSLSFSVSGGKLGQMIQAGPEMVGEEDSSDFFQRLSVRQVGGE
jgi:hypothetical protein